MDPSPPSQTPSRESPRHSRLGTLRTTIMAGLTVIVPLWITGWVLWTLFRWADGFSAPLIRQFAAGLGYPDFHIPGLGFFLTFLILWVVGLFTTNVVGKRLLGYGRRALARLPVVRTIYAPVHQLVETMTSPDKAGFKKVVMVQFPGKDVWSLGFLTGNVPIEGEEKTMHSVFVPTTPNPTTGFMLIVSQEQLRPTELSVEAAFRMIVSAGVAVPPSLRMPAPPSPA